MESTRTEDSGETAPPAAAPLSPAEIAARIDHTLLRPEATAADIARLCAEAREHAFCSVCVNPSHVRQAAGLLQGSGVRVCSVVGFPLGATTPEVKAMEARAAIRDGASEIDMVLNIGALRGRDEALVLRDLRAVVEACREGGARLKVIFENALLTDEEKLAACRLAMQAGADFVKTSTGFSTGGATVADVALMARAVASGGLGVKAAGGIRGYDDAVAMLAAGATRLGTSSGVRIVEEARARAAGRTAAPAAGGGDGY